MTDTNAVLCRDAAELVLVRRAGGHTEWAFLDRAESAPPLAGMNPRLAAMEAAGRLADADPESFWWFIRDEALDAIAAELKSASFCVVDGLLGQAKLEEGCRSVDVAVHQVCIVAVAWINFGDINSPLCGAPRPELTGTFLATLCR